MIGGIEQAAKGVINMADATVEYGNKETDRKIRYQLGIQEFAIKGERMQVQHSTNRANAMERL